MANPTLTPKQARFVAEYLKDLNATQAAVRCGYSPHTAKQQGSRLLTNADVAAAIASAQAKMADAAEIETARLVEHQSWIATFDPADLYDEQDQIRPIRQLPKHVRCCLASIDVLKVNLVSGDGSRQTVLRYRFHDKNKAADLEYKRRGLLKERLEVTQRLTLEDLLTTEDVQEAMRREIDDSVYAWAQARLGVDVARYGDDRTVIFPRQGRRAFTPQVMRHARDSSVSTDIATAVLRKRRECWR